MVECEGKASLFQAKTRRAIHFLRKIMRISSISARAIYRLIELDEPATRSTIRS
jgi:hypothetical protein